MRKKGNGEGGRDEELEEKRKILGLGKGFIGGKGCEEVGVKRLGGDGKEGNGELEFGRGMEENGEGRMESWGGQE